MSKLQRFLVILSGAQCVVAFALLLKNRIPRWIPSASIGLLVAEVAEFAAGHLHHVAIHVPLGLAIFGGAIRQLIGVLSISGGEIEAPTWK